MNSFAGTHVLSTLELSFLGLALCAFLARRAYRKHAAFGLYLACRLAVYAILVLLLRAVRGGLMEKHLAYSTYYYAYWIGYLAGAVVAFLVIQEIFGHLIEAFSNFRYLGTMAFRWVTLISVVIAVALAVRPAGLSRNFLIVASSGVMRCLSVLELCLLGFVVLSMQTLRISPRSRDFGIALGLGMVASAELLGSTFAFSHPTIASIANYSSQAAVTVAAAVWAVCFVAPEPHIETVALPESSPLARLNEVVGALKEKPPPQIALGAAHSEFFLQDVEKAVDKVLEKNSMRPAS